MVASYTASLASNLSADRQDRRTESSMENLIQAPGMKFGFVNGGATNQFFKASISYITPLFGRVQQLLISDIQIANYQSVVAKNKLK